MSNAHLNEKQLREHFRLDSKDELWLEQASRKLRLASRSFTRTLKVARTIADLAGSDNINRGISHGQRSDSPVDTGPLTVVYKL